MTATEFAGPVDFAVFVVPEQADPLKGLQVLGELAERGSIDLLDLEVVRSDGRGGGVHLDLRDSPLAGAESFVGADSGILADDDIAAVAADLGDGETALVVVYQDRSLAPAIKAWAATGVRLHAVGGVDLDELSTDLGEE